MKYMLMFWDDDTVGLDGHRGGRRASLARTATVEVRPFGDFPGDE
jgi:hypothetical protein